MRTPGNAAITAAQAALAGEHACVYGYGIVGAHLPDDAPAAHRALAQHRARRDALASMVRAAGAEPVAALSSYAPNSPVIDQASASALAVTMERRLGELYADLVADSTELRTFAADALVQVTAQVVSWGGALATFPGLDARRHPPEDPDETEGPTDR